MKTYTLDSSQINQIGYNPATLSLDIQFHGKPTVYRYPNVPADKVVGMMFAQSAGKFFGAHIKNQHSDFEKFNDPIEAGWQGELQF